MGSLREDLRAGGRELIETHISLVFLGESDVVKVKKPVNLGFVDYSTAAFRRRACEEEVRLGRRLAPQVYVGVEPVVRGENGVHAVASAAAGAEGIDEATIVDWAVRMRRLDDRDRADVRLAEGRLDPARLDDLAVRLARFHRDAPGSADVASHGTPAAVRSVIVENLAAARESIGRYVSEEQAREIESWQLAFLDDHRALLERRVREGRIRDGHGDLRLEHVYLDDGGGCSIIDCVEFSERLRCCDVCADIAFLAMDLSWNGRADWAERFLAAYARESNDFELYRLVDFYESYRAFVRGKVASILVDDTGAEPAARERAASQARRYYLLALASERRRLEPARVIAVGGVIGAGKSTLATALARELAIPVVSSDLTRKFLLDAEPHQRLARGETAWSGAYASAVTEGVYEELARRAEAVLASGRGVIVDASFRSARERERFATLAERVGVPFLFVEAHAPREVCRARLDAREAGASDARADLLDEFIASWEPADSLGTERRMIVDTSGRAQDAVASVVRALTGSARR